MGFVKINKIKKIKNALNEQKIAEKIALDALIQ